MLLASSWQGPAHKHIPFEIDATRCVSAFLCSCIPACIAMESLEIQRSTTSIVEAKLCASRNARGNYGKPDGAMSVHSSGDIASGAAVMVQVTAEGALIRVLGIDTVYSFATHAVLGIRR
jgi:hypothetical protein